MPALTDATGAPSPDTNVGISEYAPDVDLSELLQMPANGKLDNWTISVLNIQTNVSHHFQAISKRIINKVSPVQEHKLVNVERTKILSSENLNIFDSSKITYKIKFN